MPARQLIGLAGVAALILGCFAPLLYSPLGTVNYVHQGRGDGLLLLALAGIAAYLILTDNYRRLRIPTVLALLLCTFTFINITTKLLELRGQMDKDLAGNPFRGIADAFMNTIGLGWGWVFLLIGLGCLVFASLPQSQDRPLKSATADANEDQDHEPAWLANALEQIKNHQANASPTPRQWGGGQPQQRSFGKRFRG